LTKCQYVDQLSGALRDLSKAKIRPNPNPTTTQTNTPFQDIENTAASANPPAIAMTQNAHRRLYRGMAVPTPTNSRMAAPYPAMKTDRRIMNSRVSSDSPAGT
jgi:hypothetical protein